MDLFVGEPQTTHVYDFGILGRVQTLHKTSFVFSLESPGDLHVSKLLFSYESQHIGKPFFGNVGKVMRRTIPKIRLIKSCTSWIWDQYLPEKHEMESWSLGTLKIPNFGIPKP